MKFAQRVPKRSPVLKPEPVRSLDSVELNLAPLRITNKSKRYTFTGKFDLTLNNLAKEKFNRASLALVSENYFEKFFELERPFQMRHPSLK